MSVLVPDAARSSASAEESRNTKLAAVVLRHHRERGPQDVGLFIIDAPPTIGIVESMADNVLETNGTGCTISTTTSSASHPARKSGLNLSAAGILELPSRPMGRIRINNALVRTIYNVVDMKNLGLGVT